ncbi:hypothetical protein V3851_05885 [Paenibacillus sp. M1]|uniref:Uncharacterized protein n=1 Tax=Paenibacillus haidiansis TaxID=1574488 RepID=A0ABU7VPX4_9BACL
MEIKKLSKYSIDSLGDYSYTSRFKYQVSKTIDENELSITLKKVPLEKEYNKSYTTDQSDRYNLLLPMGYSFGAYEDDN